jgi:hypothetical protein
LLILGSDKVQQLLLEILTMSHLILPTVSSVPTPVAGNETSVFALLVMAGVYIGIFVPILWQQFKAGKAA